MVKVPGREILEIDDLLQELRRQISVPGAKIRQLCQELNLEAVVICGVGQHEAAITTPTHFSLWTFFNGLLK